MLFVYGTLRRGCTGPVAALLHAGSRWIGSAEARGTLYRLDGYPGFLPDAGGGAVHGDLFALDDPEALLPLLDDYEECAPHHPEPHEYRRVILSVEADGGPVNAWTYVYAWPVRAEDRITGGDFLA